MKRMILSIIIFSLFFSTIAAAAGEYGWECSSDESKAYGPIKVTYVNSNHASRSVIFSLTPQKHPIIIPGIDLLIGFNSNACEKISMKMKDSSGNEIGSYSDMPYSPFKDCDVSFAGSKENQEFELKQTGSYNGFLTDIMFKAPEDEGTYDLEIYSPEDIHLSTAEFEVPNGDTVAKTESKTKDCYDGTNNFTVKLEASHPIVIEPDVPGEIYVTISGPSQSVIKDLFENMTSMLYQQEISLKSQEDSTCSGDSCTQTYYVYSAGSTSRILYVMGHRPIDNAGYVITDMIISLLDKTKLTDMNTTLSELRDASAEYESYYTSTGDNSKADSWGEIKDDLDAMLSTLKPLLKAVDDKEFTVGEVRDLLNIIEEWPADIAELKAKIGGLNE
jgi:hypothetical protein